MTAISHIADPLAFLWMEMEEAMGSAAVHSVSRSVPSTGPVTISEVADDAQLRTQPHLHADILSMEQHVDRIVSGAQAGTSTMRNSPVMRSQWTFTQRQG